MNVDFIRKDRRIYFEVNLENVNKPILVKMNNNSFIAVCAINEEGESDINEVTFNKFKNNMYLEDKQLTFKEK